MHVERPEYVNEGWFRSSRVGIAINGPIPAHVRSDSALTSSNLWERVVHVFLRAQTGDFRHAETLLDVVHQSTDWHLRDCAVHVFGLTAPSTVLTKLAQVFDHPASDARWEAYDVAAWTGDLGLALALASRRARVEDWRERERVEDAISEVLEPPIDDPELLESKLDNESFKQRVQDLIAGLQERHGKGTFIFGGEPLDAGKLMSRIADLARDEDEDVLPHGAIGNLFDILEGMTGVSCVGWMDHPLRVDFAKVSQTLDTLKASGILDKLEPGHRYFFGHRIP